MKKQTYNPCDDCKYSYSRNAQESGMCKICELEYFKDRLLDARKQSEVAREIFEEIEKAFIKYYDECVTYSSPTLQYHTRQAAGFALNVMFTKIAELKKKYTKGE